MRVRTPQFVNDLFRDLRDRRLLIPAGALLLALVAVPVLLSRSATPLPAPPAAEPISNAATQPAVLTETVSVRDYEKRLDDLKNKNPFKEQYAAKETDGGGLEPESTGSSSPSRGGSSAASSSASGSGGDASSASSSNPPTTAPKPEPPRIESHYFTWRIDVQVGPAGDTVARNGVRQLSLLPSNNKPVAVFLGIAEGGDSAVLAVSADVDAVDTSGRCAPNPSNCAYVVLRTGQFATFDYAPDGVKYKLALKRINRVEIDKPGKQFEGKL